MKFSTSYKIRRLLFVSLLLVFIIACSGCSSENKEASLEGYWLDENGYSLTFDANGQVFVVENGEKFSGTYNIYDEDKVSILLSSFIFTDHSNFQFKIKSNVLTLTELDEGSIWTYYGDEKKQNEIREQVALRAEEAAKQEQARQNVEGYYERLDYLQSEIENAASTMQTCQTNIAAYTEKINDDSNAINNSSARISEYTQTLSGYKRQLSQLSTDSDEYYDLESSIYGLQSDIDYENSEIAYFQQEIEYYKSEIESAKQKYAEAESYQKELESELASYDNSNEDLTNYSKEEQKAIRLIKREKLSEYKYDLLTYTVDRASVNGKSCQRVQVALDAGTHVTTIGWYAVDTSNDTIYDYDVATDTYNA